MILTARLILGLNAIVICLIGFIYLYDPNILLRNYGLSVSDPSMDNMLRSTYGGLFLAMASLFGLGAISTARRAHSLELLSLFMGGLALGRIASLLMAGTPDPSILSLLAYEATASLVAIAFHWRLGTA